MVCNTTTTSFVHPVHSRCLLRRLPPQLRRDALRNDRLFLVALGPESPVVTTSNRLAYS